MKEMEKEKNIIIREKLYLKENYEKEKNGQEKPKNMMLMMQ